MARRVYMVDTENVSSSWRMMLADMTKNDVLYLFYTEHSPGIGYADFKEILESEIQPEMISCYPGKNGLDFQLVSYLGYLLKSAGRTEYFIISNDMGYDSVIHFWTEQGYKVSRITVYDLIQRKKARIALEKTEKQKAEMEKQEKEPFAENTNISAKNGRTQKISAENTEKIRKPEISRSVDSCVSSESTEQESIEKSIDIPEEELRSKKKINRQQRKSREDNQEKEKTDAEQTEACLESEHADNGTIISVEQKQPIEMTVQIQEMEQPKKRGRKKKIPENPVENTAELQEKESETKAVDGRSLLAELLAAYDDIDVDTVVEILRHGSKRQLKKKYTQMLKLFGHQAGVELYHVLKPHFPVLFTYAKNEIEQ